MAEVEILERRQNHAKHWRRDDGKIHSSYGLDDIHYKDSSGNWKDVDTTLIEKTGNNFEVTKHVFRPSFNRFQVPSVYHKRGHSALTINPQDTNTGNLEGVVTDNEINYTDVYTETDVRRVVIGGGVKEFITLKASGHPTQFRYQITCAYTPEIIDKEIVFKDGEEVVYVIQPLVVVNDNQDEEPVILDWVIDGNEIYFDVPGGITYPYVIDPSVSTRVGHTDNDSRRNPFNWSNTSEHEIGDNSGNRHSQDRFDGITIAAGSTIDTATLTLTSFGTWSTNTCNVLIKLHDVDDSSQVTTAGDFDGRLSALTTGTAWNSIPTWANNSENVTPDFASEVQTVIDRAGWASGQAINIFIVNNVSSSNARRGSYDYSQNSTRSALLDMTWTEGGGGGAGAIMTPNTGFWG